LRDTVGRCDVVALSDGHVIVTDYPVRKGF
jgi:hypothetical protein